jgi:hypothetical protein
MPSRRIILVNNKNVSSKIENVSMISVEAGSILVALSRIDKECDHLVLKALKTCDIPVPFMTY